MNKIFPQSFPNVAIIIPIYNALDDLSLCMESVFKHTSDNIPLLLINDASTDKRIGSYLSKLKANNVKVVQNAENLGFVATVNRGMQEMKDYDVILLNTDTIVTSGWVKKLHECAYSRELIGTVTPLSNNGNGICSVPMFNQVNDIPKGFTIDSFAKLIEHASLKQYQEIPTGVGFCMYIKSEVLNKFGYFDEKTFGKGYGEETDFCLRIHKGGYENILDDATYIYHKGGASFDYSEIPSEERKNNNLVVLQKRYPSFLNDWNSFVTNNPLKKIHSRIFFWMKCVKLRIPLFLRPALFKIAISLKVTK